MNKVEYRFATPQLHQITQTRPTELSLFDQNVRLWGTICYGFRKNPAIVAFMYLRLLHPDGFWVPDQRLDLLELLKASATDAPVEPAASPNVTPLRKGKQIRAQRKPKLG